MFAFKQMANYIQTKFYQTLGIGIGIEMWIQILRTWMKRQIGLLDKGL